MDWKAAAVRAVRTFAQTSIGVYLAGLIGTPMLGDLADITLIDSTAAAGVVAVLTFAHNALEDWRDVTYERRKCPVVLSLFPE